MRPPVSTNSMSSYIAGSRFFIAKPAIRVRWLKIIGFLSARRASACFSTAARNAPSRSSGPRTSKDWSLSPNNWAAAAASLKLEAAGGPQSTATREILETVSLSSSSRLPVKSPRTVVRPVMFPPGLAKLATNLFSTGFPAAAITIGIVLVACLAARVDGLPPVTMVSTFSRTKSAARPGSRSSRASPSRYSITIVFPST